MRCMARQVSVSVSAMLADLACGMICYVLWTREARLHVIGKVHVETGVVPLPPMGGLCFHA